MNNNIQNDTNTEIPQIIAVEFHPVIQKTAEKIMEKKTFTNSVTPPSPPSVPEPIKFHGERTNGTVDPITDIEDIQIAKDYFLNRETRYSNNQNNIRDYALFVIGINCARRIGDLLQLQVSDFFYEDYTWREHFRIKEQKTGKHIKIRINSAVKETLPMLFLSIGEYNLNTFIFQSRNGVNQPITTHSAQKIMKDMSRDTGLDRKYNIGTHSLRKTWARQYYEKNPTKLVIIQKALNHSHQNTTLTYIGIKQDEIDEAFIDNVL